MLEVKFLSRCGKQTHCWTKLPGWLAFLGLPSATSRVGQVPGTALHHPPGQWAVRVHATSTSKAGGSRPVGTPSRLRCVAPLPTLPRHGSMGKVPMSGQAFGRPGQGRHEMRRWALDGRRAIAKVKCFETVDDVNGGFSLGHGSRGEVAMMNVCLSLQMRWTLLKKREERIQARPWPKVPTLKVSPLSPLPSLPLPPPPFPRLHTHHHIHPSARHPSSVLVSHLPASMPSPHASFLHSHLHLRISTPSHRQAHLRSLRW